ncbi:MAG: universal stress protein [Thermoleophilia bacterium]
MRLLVGFDGSDGGRDALELARVLATETEGSVAVATVLFGGPLPLELAGLEGPEAEAAEPLFEEARSRLAGIELETRAYGGGSPAAVLTELAEQDEFDAIVLGSPHRGPLGRVLIGSVARNLLNGGPREVFVASRGYADAEHDPFRRIAVGYDGSPEAKQALQSAEALAKHSNAILRLIAVVSMPVFVPGAVGYTPAPAPLDAEKLLSDAAASIDPKLAVEQRRCDGSPGPVLVSEAENDVDLLVLGSRGYGPLARVLLGSVSRHAAQNAPCPVLVVPRP